MSVDTEIKVLSNLFIALCTARRWITVFYVKLCFIQLSSGAELNLYTFPLQDSLTHLDVKHSDEVWPLWVVFDQAGHSTASLHPAAAPLGRIHLDDCRTQSLNTQRTETWGVIIKSIQWVKNYKNQRAAVNTDIKTHQFSLTFFVMSYNLHANMFHSFPLLYSYEMIYSLI